MIDMLIGAGGMLVFAIFFPEPFTTLKAKVQSLAKKIGE